MKKLQCIGFCLLVVLAFVSCATPVPLKPAPAFRVLVFSKTTAFRHDSIPSGIAAIAALGQREGFAVEATENAAWFSDEKLGRYQAVIFLNTTGDVFDDAQRAALQRYIRSGHGYVGVHAASDTEFGWPWYGQLVGAWFRNHPKIQTLPLAVVDRSHASTRRLPERWTREDEWYNFRSPPQNVQVLIRLDEATYQGGNMGADHPIAWCHPFEGGRVWFTGLGHTVESWSEPLFLQHLSGGIHWAAGQ